MRVKATTALTALILLLSLAVLPGCASKKAATAPPPADEDAQVQIADPLEPWNRFWFGFNDVFYTGFGKPFSKAYTFVVPKYARDRIENAYANLLFPVRFANALFQLRPDKASRELGRFIVNSTFGLGGFYDMAATGKDLKPQRIDFGQTLGVWGMGHGFYLVLPFIGPSSLRDGVGTAVDIAIMPTSYVDVPYLLTVGIGAAGRINRIPEMLDIYEELKRSSFEPYVAARDAYAQIRAKMVNDAIASAWVKTAAPPAQ